MISLIKNNMSRNFIVISVGGSLIVPEKIDISFLRAFQKLILKYVKKGKRFIIISGGGRTARNYQKAANILTKLIREDIDWLGIHATRINAHLLKAIFYKQAHPKIIKNPLEKVRFKEKILIAAGWKPGFSTDYDAVMLAKNVKTKILVNLTNVDFVYDKNPKEFKDAKPYKLISWKKFRTFLPRKWRPGLSTPFDPIASKEAEKIRLEVAVINGKKLKRLENYLDGKDFIGTVITPRI